MARGLPHSAPKRLPPLRSVASIPLEAHHYQTSGAGSEPWLLGGKTATLAIVLEYNDPTALVDLNH